MKKLITRLALGVFVTTLGVLPAAPVCAQSDKEATSFDVTEPLEIGPVTLQPGVYLIKVVLLNSNRNVLQVTDVDEKKIFAKVLSRPHPVLADEVVPVSRLVYYTTANGQAKAIKTWWARDTGNGHEIVYPRKRAMELAAMSKEPIVSIPDEVQEAEYKSVPFMVVTPEQKVTPYEPPAVVAEVRPKRLPKTGSRVPLALSLGFLALAGAVSLRALGHRAS